MADEELLSEAREPLGVSAVADEELLSEAREPLRMGEVAARVTVLLKRNARPGA